jgi:hypothetical protein
MNRLAELPGRPDRSSCAYRQLRHWRGLMPGSGTTVLVI